MAQRYYAVARGRHPGIYTDWETAKAEVSGFANARYHGFASDQEAQMWLEQQTGDQQRSPLQPHATIPVKTAADSTAPKGIQVYTDGGSRNTGNKLGQHVNAADRAAWAYSIQLPDGTIFSDSGSEWGATNNRMELLALINALQALQSKNLQTQTILLTSDSHYVLDPIKKKWLRGWSQRGWRKASGGIIANLELWQQIQQLLPTFSDLTLAWTKGHADNAGNNHVDRLLNEAMDRM
ncbi:ribonuclease H family protein [Lapidilactobacillus luobeiensis]|uniref:ribonuclease H family protein n=1 Tax=Lapidilactobacillus luobeiensis TaxID=2950371 RepID=UPI0021C3F68D|nr:ribonuclease H family protein [Lapidilactobacillus luobeiensis]